MQKILSPFSAWLKRMPEQRMLVILAVFTGLGCGLATVILKQAIHGIQRLLTGWFNASADSLLYFIYPGIGMLLAFLLVKYVIKDNISHGVTKVLHAISKNESKIKTHNCYSSMAVSSVTIGFGGSVGAEAPIVYTGAAIGSNIARILGLNYRQMTLLLGCGAAGAVAGIFKAPLAGILFTLEILMFNLSMSSVLPLLITTITATVVSSVLMGSDVAFATTAERFWISNLPYYVGLGILCGFVSLYFTRMTLYLEDKIHAISKPLNRWLFSAIGLGMLIFIFPPLYGESYGALSACLNDNVEPAVNNSLLYGNLAFKPWFLPLFFTCVLFFKVVAMSLTNAGGGVGGTFGPTLVVGGMLGFVMSRSINLMGIHYLPEANFALTGMAGLMAGVMQAPLTAIFLIAEITGGYKLLLPLIITSACSFATIRGFEPYSIYTKRLAKAGDLLTHDNDQAVLVLLHTADLVETDFKTVGINDTLHALVQAVSSCKRNVFPVLDSDGTFAGVVLLDKIREIMFDRELYQEVLVQELMQPPPDIVRVDEKMEQVMEKFETSGAWNLPVVDAKHHYLGFVSKSQIFSAYREQLTQLSQE
ncbi:MAG: chloride channel protein, partial [Bacteroidetes bacterium]|nr:chloride channel protein [Bacteroidota bacterium]